MPVPGRAFKAEVALVGKVTLHQPNGDEKQHQHAHQHVKAVEAREHVESGAKHARVELKVVVVVEVVVLRIGYPYYLRLLFIKIIYFKR